MGQLIQFPKVPKLMPPVGRNGQARAEDRAWRTWHDEWKWQTVRKLCELYRIVYDTEKPLPCRHDILADISRMIGLWHAQTWTGTQSLNSLNRLNEETAEVCESIYEAMEQALRQ